MADLVFLILFCLFYVVKYYVCKRFDLQLNFLVSLPQRFIIVRKLKDAARKYVQTNITAYPLFRSSYFSLKFVDTDCNPELHCHRRSYDCTARQCSPLRRQFMECSINNPALSLLMKHLVIGQRLKTPNFSAFRWSPRGSVVSIGQHFVATRVVHVPKSTETSLITESDQSGPNHQLLRSYARPARPGPIRTRLCGPCIAVIAGYTYV